MQPLTVLPFEIQRDWLASLQRQVSPTAQGHFYLVAIRTTRPKSFEEGRIIVSTIDENGFPLANVPVAFSYSTAHPYILTPDFLWLPPAPQRAFVIPTGGAGAIDQIQGDVVKAGEPGGVTVYCLKPEYSSDTVAGLGMLSNHTGLALTFQLQRNGIKSLQEQLDMLTRRVEVLEAR